MPGNGRHDQPAHARCRRALGLLLGVTLGTAALADAGAAVNFAVPATTLPAALIELARQADLSLVFATASVPRRATPAITGMLSPREALSRLLEGSGLVPAYLADRVVSIGPACASATDCAVTGPAGSAAGGEVDSREIEQIIVRERLRTGSHINHSRYLGAAPVSVLSAPEIEASGAQSLGELLRGLPVVIGNQTSTAVSNGGDGTATVTLRGLPASNTLVLVNGHRASHGGLAGDAFDLNTVAPATVERIEILKEGASAVYGSDAIAGVVNIILKRDFDGVQVGTHYGETGHGDRGTRATSLLAGNVFTRGSLLFSATVYEQDEVWSRDRAVSRNADGRARGGADLRSSATPAARIELDGQALSLGRSNGGYLPGSSPGDFVPAGDEDLYNFREHTSALVPSERTNLYGSARYELGERSTLIAELAHARNESEATLAPTPVFTAFESLPLTIAAQNAYNPFGVDILDLRKRVLELGPREQDNSSHTTRAVLGLEGMTGRSWEWNASWSWSRTESEESLHGLIDGDRLQRGLGSAAACSAASGCVPVNLFGPPGAIDPLQAAYLRTETGASGYSRLNALEASISGPVAALAAGEVVLAAGSTWREEATGSRGARSNPLHALGGEDIAAASGERRVGEAWGELLVPLFGDEGGDHRVDMELAARLSHYSDFGNTTNGKAGLRYRVLRDVLLRGTWSQGFRAPSLLDLYQRSEQSQAFLNDPCAVPDNVGVLPGCALPGDPTRTQYLTLVGGNEELEPEQSSSFTAGVVWTPADMAGLMVSVDGFSIEQHDVIDASAQYILDHNAQHLAYAGRVQRDATGNLQRVVATNINVGERRLSGVDFDLRYRLRALPVGRFSVSLESSWIHEYLEQPDPAAPRTDIVGTFADEASGGTGAIPEWKSRLSLAWSHARWQASYRVYHVSELEEVVPNTTRRRHIDSWLVHDLQVGRDFDLLEGLRVRLGIDNVFDREAPFAASAFNDNVDGRTHDLRGRYWYAMLTQEF
jgi:iron complex outermembrane receptor protein